MTRIKTITFNSNQYRKSIKECPTNLDFYQDFLYGQLRVDKMIFGNDTTEFAQLFIRHLCDEFNESHGTEEASEEQATLLGFIDHLKNEILFMDGDENENIRKLIKIKKN